MSVAHSWVTVLQTVTALIQKDPLSAEVSALDLVLKKLYVGYSCKKLRIEPIVHLSSVCDS